MKLIDLLEAPDFNALQTDDFQRRDGNYPKSNVPDTIESHGNGASFSFKNTSENDAKAWVVKFLKQKGLAFDEIHTSQDGDYEDDWVDVTVSSKKH